MQGMLKLSQDRFNQIELPTFQQVTLPSSQAQLTGMLPVGYGGGYGGSASADFLNSALNAFGQVGSNLDPRYAQLGYTADQRTLAGRSLDLQGDDLRARYEHMD